MITFNFNQGAMDNEELKKRTKFWNKKQFQTWSKKEIERSSKFMQSLLAAIKDLDEYDIDMIRRKSLGSMVSRSIKDPEYIIWRASASNIKHAIEIAPKTFKVKQG